MKKKIILTVAMVAGLILTACGSKEKESENYSSQTENTTQAEEIIIPTIDPKSDEGKVFDANLDQSFINKFKDFIDYTFDGKYELSLPYSDISRPGTEYSQNAISWDFKFTAPNGIDMKEKLMNTDYMDYEVQYYPTKDVHDLAELDSFVTLIMGYIARDDFAEQIASKYLDVEYNAISDTFITPEGELTVLAYPPLYIGSLGEDLYQRTLELTQERMAVDSGWKISETNLASIGQSKDFTFSCRLVLDEGVDADGYVEMMENIMKDYQEIVGTPQNYSFFLAQTGNSEWIYRKLGIMGEEISDDLINDENYNFSNEMKNAILESHE